MPGSTPLRCRLPLATLLLVTCTWATAQSTAEVLRGQDVTIIAGEQRTIYEYRQNGVLRYVRIVPKTGRPYFLRPADPTRGGGDLERADQLLPSWVLVEF